MFHSILGSCHFPLKLSVASSWDLWTLLVLHKDQVCQLKIKRERKLWKLLGLHRDQVCEQKIKREREG